jgi:hypothetical protein
MRMFDWHKAYFQGYNPDLVETRATMATLAAYANFDNLTCFPSQRTLARLLDCSTETIRRHIKKNIEAGWLRKIRNGNSYSLTNMYEFTIPTPLAHEGSVTPSLDDQLPTPMRGVSNSPRTNRPTPLAHEGRTPLTSVGLTTKRTTKSSSSKGVLEDPWSLPGLPSTSTNKETPLAHEGSSHPTEDEISAQKTAEANAFWLTHQSTSPFDDPDF